eukprot:Sro31_g020420.2  (373) ;mRNA; r:126014-127132
MEKRQDDNDNPETRPWYRRYPTLTLERMRGSVSSSTSSNSSTTTTTNNAAPLDNRTQFYGQCLQRQLYQPPAPYPAWVYDWDGKMNDSCTKEALSTAQGLQKSSCTGTTRHILLVRHGQYEEAPFDDRKRCLTALGRKQAQLTGKRLATLVQQIAQSKKIKAHVHAIYTSDMLRAKQTAWIMAQAMPDNIPIRDPDPDLNEGLPAPMIPPRPDLPGVEEEVDAQQERMERVFRKYFYRADPSPQFLQAWKDNAAAARNQNHTQDYNISPSGTVVPIEKAPKQQQPPKPMSRLPPPDHEFDIIVCHGNVIRYFLCRALQLPPEAWLRFSVFNCSVSYIMIKPNGYVSCRMIGDIGHLGYKETTFSGAHGLLWS